MSVNTSDLLQFHQFITDQLRHDAELSPEDCLDLWRANHPTPADLAESVAAIKEGLAQAERGEGKPLEEFLRSFWAAAGLAGNGR